MENIHIRKLLCSLIDKGVWQSEKVKRIRKLTEAELYVIVNIIAAVERREDADLSIRTGALFGYVYRLHYIRSPYLRNVLVRFHRELEIVLRDWVARSTEKELLEVLPWIP